MLPEDNPQDLHTQQHLYKILRLMHFAFLRMMAMEVMHKHFYEFGDKHVEKDKDAGNHRPNSNFPTERVEDIAKEAPMPRTMLFHQFCEQWKVW